MRQRPLGKCGLIVSEIGFGTWGIGGTHGDAVGYGPTDDATSAAALRRAFDLGVTYYDTADLYGRGHSEVVLGRTFHDVREHVVIGTKVGFVEPGDSQEFSARHLRESLEASLRRLQTDYVDVYHLHGPRLELLESDDSTRRVLEQFVQEGKVRVLAISLRSPADAPRAIQELGFNILQLNFNMADQRLLQPAIFDVCETAGVGIICRTPLCFGFLTGQYEVETVFDSHDHRSRWAPEQIRLWIEAAAAFQADSESYGRSPTELALRFCLSQSVISTVIPGMLTVRQVEENVRAGQPGPLPDAIRRNIEDRYGSLRTFIPEGRPPQ